jgi:hypothetical protein
MSLPILKKTKLEQEVKVSGATRLLLLIPPPPSFLLLLLIPPPPHSSSSSFLLLLIPPPPHSSSSSFLLLLLLIPPHSSARSSGIPPLPWTSLPILKKTKLEQEVILYCRVYFNIVGTEPKPVRKEEEKKYYLLRIRIFERFWILITVVSGSFFFLLIRPNKIKNSADRYQTIFGRFFK